MELVLARTKSAFRVGQKANKKGAHRAFMSLDWKRLMQGKPYFRLAPSPYLIPFNSLNRLMSAPNSSATRARSVVFFTSSCS
jgi:hypothetical protein